jgi:hypothetical protein
MRIEVSGYFTEVVNRLEDEGAFDRQAYYDMVEEVLEEKLENGLLTDDDDIETMKETLRQRWPEAEEAFTSGHDQDVIEDHS